MCFDRKAGEVGVNVLMSKMSHEIVHNRSLGRGAGWHAKRAGVSLNYV